MSDLNVITTDYLVHMSTPPMTRREELEASVQSKQPMEVVHEEEVDSVYSSSPPFSSHEDDLLSPDAYVTRSSNKLKRFSHSSTASSVTDSGTESMIDDDYLSEMATNRILQFFASDHSKSNRLTTRRATTGAIRQLSYYQDDDEENESNFDTDESTLSESSVLNSPEFDTPRSEMFVNSDAMVAAVGERLRQMQLVTESNTPTAAIDTDGTNDSANQQTGDSCTSEAREQTHVDSVPSHTSGTDDSLNSKMPGEDAIPNTDCDLAHVNGKQCMLGIDDEDSDGENNTCNQRVLIRSTSLKTGKTPPGTPCAKKIVRFADALGLDLESVRHIVDDVPYVPPLAAFKELKLDEEDRRWIFNEMAPTPSIMTLSTLKPTIRTLFCQPSSEPAMFLERVRSNHVCLENCMVSGPSGPSDLFTITCLVRVLNTGFEKAVTLRYTTNEWLTWNEVVGNYVPNSCDGFSDKFVVIFDLAVNSNGVQTMMPGQRLMFAIRFVANGTLEHWDNNLGLNYSLIYQRS